MGKPERSQFLAKNVINVRKKLNRNIKPNENLKILFWKNLVCENLCSLLMRKLLDI